MIERLLVLCETRQQKDKMERELLFKSNDNIRAIYESAKPRLQAHQEQLDRVIRRENKQRQFFYAMKIHNEACVAWSRRWRHPRVVYPLSPPPERQALDFGVAEVAVYLLGAAKRAVNSPLAARSRSLESSPGQNGNGLAVQTRLA